MKRSSNHKTLSVIKRRSIESEEFWREHAKKLPLSKLTRKEYCQQNAVNYDRFGYWLGRFAQQTPSFVPINIKSEEAIIRQSEVVKTLCSIEFNSKHLLKIYDLATVQFILERLG